MKQNTRPPRSIAHALNALTSLVGIFAIPAVILRACPEAPLAQPLHFIIRISGAWLPLVWVPGSVALWLLMLSRMHGFKNLFSPTRCRRPAERPPHKQTTEP